jgi:hypothetical protein
MSEIVVDFSEAVERQLLAPDWYRVRIESIEQKTSSSGKPMLSVMLRVSEGQYAEQALFTNWMLAGKGAGITKGAFRAFLGDEVVDSGQSRYTLSDFEGAEAMARVTNRVWKEEDGGDGEMQNRVSRYKPLEFHIDEGEVEGLFTE